MVITPKGVMLSIKEFKELPDYSCSIPTGTRIGKRWKRRTPYEIKLGVMNTYRMGEYVESSTPGYVDIEWTTIILPDGYDPEDEAKRYLAALPDQHGAEAAGPGKP